jgi:hypothetical protein
MILPITGSYSFENYLLPTGQITALNNTNSPIQNQEYNILYLDPQHIILSYQGPFWGNSDVRCDIFLGLDRL